MKLFKSNEQVIHVYHHYEGEPCEKCGYIEGRQYNGQDALYNHLFHTIEESEVLSDLKRRLESKEV